MKVIFLQFVLILSLLTEAFPQEHNTPNIYKEGNAIHYYDEYLSLEAFEKFKTLYDPSVKALFIDSRGGAIEIGMDFGEFIHKHELDVHIKGHCFSSCANYIFPAGKNKYLDKNSQIGWHGSAFQVISDADREALSQTEKDTLDRDLSKTREREFKFYSMIGVEPLTPVYGLNNQYPECVGWTYSLKALEQLKIHNIILTEQSWEPAPTFNDKCIFTIDRLD